MLQPTYDTHSDLVAQHLGALSDTQWQRFVQHSLPPDLEEQAQVHHAFCRKRHLASAGDLLRGLLCYTLSQSSFQQLCLWALGSLHESKPLSKQAWHKRLYRSSTWLHWLVSTLLVGPSVACQEHTSRLLLVDGTHFSCRGRYGKNWQVRCTYDLFHARVVGLRVKQGTGGENLCDLPLRKGDIVLADAGHSHAASLLAVLDAHASPLIRWSPVHLPLALWQQEAQDDALKLDWKTWLPTLSVGLHQLEVQFIQGTRRVRMRLIVQVPPEQEAQRLREIKSKQARDKGRVLSEDGLLLAGYLLLVTTLPEEHWPAERVVQAYQCRWHVETHFKRFKQILDAHRLDCTRTDTAQAMVATLLIAWLLIEAHTHELSQTLDQAPRPQHAEEGPHSLTDQGQGRRLYQLHRLSAQVLEQVVKGYWDPRTLKDHLPQWDRLLQDKRKRPNVEQMRRTFFGHLLGHVAGCTTAFSCSSA